MHASVFKAGGRETVILCRSSDLQICSDTTLGCRFLRPVQQLTFTGLFLISLPREPVPPVVVHCCPTVPVVVDTIGNIDLSRKRSRTVRRVLPYVPGSSGTETSSAT